MSRRGAEFQHRTSVFEGAYRAWSYLGKLEPKDLESKSASELDPTANPIGKDARDRVYSYEPLPRSGLAHPFVKVVLSPWLGPDVDEDGVKLGLETLRTWWQHRRKGQNSSALKALNSDKMRTAVDEYTRHFFRIAHCLIFTDKEQPPKSLQLRLKKYEKDVLIGLDGSDIEQSYSGRESIPSSSKDDDCTTLFDLTGKCVPGKINLPELMKGVNHKALQIAHRGNSSRQEITNAPTTIVGTNIIYGDPDTFPIVYISGNGERQIALKVDGITCAHCIKIVETVLKGCSGQRSPIDGLLDAVADHDLNGVLIKFEPPTVNAKRISYEATRNLELVGYKAETILIEINKSNDSTLSVSESLQKTIIAFETLGSKNSPIIFDWNVPCACPDGGVYRSNCRRYVALSITLMAASSTSTSQHLFCLQRRHSQIESAMFDHFLFRKQQVVDFVSGKDWIQTPTLLQDQVNLVDPMYDPNPVFESIHDDEEPIIVDQELNFGFDSTTLQLDSFPTDGMQFSMQRSHTVPFCMPSQLPPDHPQAINTLSNSYIPEHDFQPISLYGDSSIQNVSSSNCGYKIHTSQQMSALATDFGLSTGYGWDNLIQKDHYMMTPHDGTSSMQSWM
jgi:copper chaperone CopZ